MKDGALQQAAPPLELYRRPANRFVAGFIGSPPMNFFEGAIVQRNGGAMFQSSFEVLLDAARVKPQNGADGRVTLGLRPENIAEESNEGITAVVERVEATGVENLVYCSCNGASFVSRLPASRTAKAGDTMKWR